MSEYAFEAVVPVSAEIEARVVGLAGFLVEAEALDIADGESYAAALELVRDGKRRLAEMEEMRTSATRPLNAALEQINSWFRPRRERLQAAVDALMRKAFAWKRAQEEAERERQRRALAAAEAERQRLLKLAEAAEKKGKAVQAAALEHQAEQLSVLPAAAPAVPKVEGVHAREVWRWRCKVPGCGQQDCEHLLEALPRKYLLVNTALIGKVVRAEKQLANIPGVEPYREESFAAR